METKCTHCDGKGYVLDVIAYKDVVCPTCLGVCYIEAAIDDYKRHIAELKEGLAELEAELAQQNCTMTKVCHWTQDCELWESTCGIEWCFPELDTTPKDNDMNYCPKCGGVLIEAKED